MNNWGEEIGVDIIYRRPDFVGKGDLCAIFSNGAWHGLNSHYEGRSWNWKDGVTKIKLAADNPYYKKDKPVDIVISREAAIEASRRLGFPVHESAISDVVKGVHMASHELAKAIQRLWDLCPSERPVDNRVIAMRHAWVAGNRAGTAWDAKVLEGEYDETIIKAVETFDAKLAQLEGGK